MSCCIVPEASAREYRAGPSAVVRSGKRAPLCAAAVQWCRSTATHCRQHASSWTVHVWVRGHGTFTASVRCSTPGRDAVTLG